MRQFIKIYGGLRIAAKEKSCSKQALFLIVFMSNRSKGCTLLYSWTDVFSIQTTYQRKSLTTVYTSVKRPHLASGDIISDQAYNSSFFVKLESIQYNAALTITGEILQKNNSIKSQALNLWKTDDDIENIAIFMKYLSNNPQIELKIFNKELKRHYAVSIELITTISKNGICLISMFEALKALISLKSKF